MRNGEADWIVSASPLPFLPEMTPLLAQSPEPRNPSSCGAVGATSAQPATIKSAKMAANSRNLLIGLMTLISRSFFGGSLLTDRRRTRDEISRLRTGLTQSDFSRNITYSVNL